MWEEARIGSGLEEAEANLISSLELNPNNASAYMWFALVRGAQQRTEEAIELYHKSLRVDPLGKIPYANLPSLYAMRGQNEEALDLYVKAVEIHPDWPTAYQNLGLHLNGLGRIDEAVAWGIKGRELSTDPTRGAPIVMAYVEFGDYDKIAALASGVEPGHPMYEIGHSTLVALRGDPAGAAKIIESALQGVENPRQIHLNLMTTFSRGAAEPGICGGCGPGGRCIQRRQPDPLRLYSAKPGRESECGHTARCGVRCRSHAASNGSHRARHTGCADPGPAGKDSRGTCRAPRRDR
jgi:hypothetical protein